MEKGVTILNRKARDIREAILRMFDNEKIADFSFRPSAKHHKVCFAVNGLYKEYIFSGTGGDVRTIQNTVSGIRRIIRQVRGQC